MSDAQARKLHQRYRDLRALADDKATPAAEADNARRQAARVAAQLRALGYGQPAHVTPSRPAPAVVQPESGIPTIIIFDQRTAQHRTYHVAARYWCPACNKGRHHNGRCPVCDGATEAVRPRM